jgi:hypothetical protein
MEVNSSLILSVHHWCCTGVGFSYGPRFFFCKEYQEVKVNNLDFHSNKSDPHRDTDRGLYTGKYPGGGGGSANVRWGKKYEKGNRKKTGNVKEKGKEK